MDRRIRRLLLALTALLAAAGAGPHSMAAEEEECGFCIEEGCPLPGGDLEIEHMCDILCENHIHGYWCEANLPECGYTPFIHCNGEPN